VKEQRLTSRLTHNTSIRRQLFAGNRWYWYWQSNS